MQNMHTILREFGLDEKEIMLYLASLALGESNMSDLARNAGLKRTTAYLVFKSLEEKGLMASFKMRSGLRFVSTNPEILISKTKRQLEELQTVIPELKTIIHKADKQPNVYFYEGKNGYIVVAEDSLKIPNVTIRHIGSLTEIHNVIGTNYDVDYYIPNRLKNRIFFKALYFQSEIPDAIKKRTEELREIRYLPEQYRFRTSILIYGNKIALFSTKNELITVVIESKEIAESEKKKFDLIWDLIGKQN